MLVYECSGRDVRGREYAFPLHPTWPPYQAPPICPKWRKWLTGVKTLSHRLTLAGLQTWKRQQIWQIKHQIWTKCATVNILYRISSAKSSWSKYLYLWSSFQMLWHLLAKIIDQLAELNSIVWAFLVHCLHLHIVPNSSVLLLVFFQFLSASSSDIFPNINFFFLSFFLSSSAPKAFFQDRKTALCIFSRKIQCTLCSSLTSIWRTFICSPELLNF